MNGGNCVVLAIAQSFLAAGANALAGDQAWRAGCASRLAAKRLLLDRGRRQYGSTTGSSAVLAPMRAAAVLPFPAAGR